MQVYDIPNCSALDKGRAWQALYHLERVGGRAWAQDLPAALLQVHLHLHLHLPRAWARCSLVPAAGRWGSHTSCLPTSC